MKTKEQIQGQIEWLRLNKNKIPSQSAFGDDNHEKIDAEIITLEQIFSDDISDEDGAEELAEEKGWDDDTRACALAIIAWITDESADSPEDNWKGLIKS